MKAKDAALKQNEDANLDGRYGEIGISAVAAALRYNGEAKNPAYAPAPPKDDNSLTKWYAKVTAA